MPQEREILQINGNHITAQFLEGFGALEGNPRLKKKLLDRDELGSFGEFCRRHGVRIAFTTGVFDMIHIGHARYLELARSLGDVLVVGLNSDSSVREIKGPDRPVLTEHQRAEMLSYLAPVNYMTIFPETTGAEVIKSLQPDIYLCVEGSWEGDLASKSEVVAMAEHGGVVCYTPRQDPMLSTTAIIERITQIESPRILAELRSAMENGDD